MTFPAVTVDHMDLPRSAGRKYAASAVALLVVLGGGWLLATGGGTPAPEPPDAGTPTEGTTPSPDGTAANPDPLVPLAPVTLDPVTPLPDPSTLEVNDEGFTVPDDAYTDAFDVAVADMSAVAAAFGEVHRTAYHDPAAALDGDLGTLFGPDCQCLETLRAMRDGNIHETSSRVTTTASPIDVASSGTSLLLRVTHTFHDVVQTVDGVASAPLPQRQVSYQGAFARTADGWTLTAALPDSL